MENNITHTTNITKLESHDITLELIDQLFHVEKMYETTYEHSLFKKILSSCLDSQSLSPLNNHTLYLLHHTVSNDLMGLSMVKSFEKEIIPLFELKDSFLSNSKIGTIYDKQFLLQDWFQIYIKPEYREQGFAVALLHFVEDDLIRQYQLNDSQIPLIIGTGIAHDLIEQKAKYFFALPHDQYYKNKVYDLSNTTKKIIDYIFEPVGHKSFLSNFNQQFSIISHNDKNNQLKNQILGKNKR